MTKRALLPGEQEAWERACAKRRWVVRAAAGRWLCQSGDWLPSAEEARMAQRQDAFNTAFTGDVIAYRARSVRADGTPVVP